MTAFLSDGAAVAKLFSDLWQHAVAWTPPQRSMATMNEAYAKWLREALREENDSTVADVVRRSLPSSFQSNDERGRLLQAMEAIDDAYYSIHPKAVSSVPGSVHIRVPAWLEAQSRCRRKQGVFWRDEASCLIARGPLLRTSRGRFANFADTLADRFAALAIVPTVLYERGRPIRVVHKAVGVSAVRGVPPARTPGAESVLFVPIAFRRGELLFESQTRGGGEFLVCSLASGVSAQERFLQALASCSGSDIAIGPELVVSESAADTIAARFVAEVDNPPRLLVLGSGVTNATDAGQPWNETRVISRSGKELWRQRKLWPAGINTERAREYGLPPPRAGMYLEDTSAGGELVVVDIDGLGRCLILICQDLEARPLSDDALREYQPDWIFSPVLDRGVIVGRWAHQRTLALSTLSEARFLVAGSTTLACGGAHDHDCGIAVGPRDPSDPTDPGRQVLLAQCVTVGSSAYAQIQWRSPDWSQSELSSKKI